MDKIKCIGCGSLLQSEDEQKSGFINPSALEKNEENLLCKRCFRLKHYNDIQDVELDNDDFLKILNQVALEDALIVKVVDVFDLTGSMISGMQRLVGNNDIILVGNKRDVLPKSIKSHKIINWMRRIIKDYGLKVVDCVLTSAHKGLGIDELVEVIEEHRKGKNVYIVGCTNVGKSTLINAIIKRFYEEKDDVITVSQFPGTTLGIIEIPFGENTYLIDTPGIINTHQYAHYLSKSSLKHIMPKKEIKPKVYQLNEYQTLFFDGLARFDFIKGERTSFVCFFSNSINIHRTKLENASNLFEKHIGELLSPPHGNEINQLGSYKAHHFKTPNYKCDVVISGLGYITIAEPNLQIAIHAPKHVGVFIRPSLL